MSSPERRQGAEKTGTVLKKLGKFALVAFGVVLGAELLVGDHGILNTEHHLDLK